MSADGNWKITISTPMGPQEVTAQITTQGDTFTGRSESAMGSQEITGKVSGDTLSWTSDITKPMPLKLEFEVKVEGDKLSGTCKLGAFGNAPVTGQRI
jgi:hypothetical protein